MRIKWTGDQAVVVPEVGPEPVEPGDIIEVDGALGRRMAKSELWKVTSRDKAEVAEEAAEEEEET